MDNELALDLSRRLKGKKINKWIVDDYINCGKSALVCKCNDGQNEFAIKIFDNNLISKFGLKIQNERIDRQKTLIGKNHKNLIDIYDGGYDKENQIYYVVMKYLNEYNLSQKLINIPEDKITIIISQIAQAAFYLETIGLSHRDIKPENISISSDFENATLLDLGVIKPIGKAGVTDYENIKPFLGTLQYSPPEFLLRKENDTIEGWRAVTFYQIGAVLHDLIMKYPIFKDHVEPYGKLVNAICNETPNIFSNTINNNLLLLAKASLLKDPILRLRILNWDNFKLEKLDDENLDTIKNRIRNKRLITNEKKNQDKINFAYEDNLKFFQYELQNIFETIIRELTIGNPDFPHSERHVTKNINSIKILIGFPASFEHSLRLPLSILLNCIIIDLNDKIIQINYASVLSNNFPYNIEPNTYEILYEGLYDINVLQLKIDKLINSIFDVAQNIDSDNLDEQNTFWIDYTNRKEQK